MSEDDLTDEAEAGTEAKGGGAPWLPLILVLLLVPIITIAGMEFVVIPKLKKALASEASGVAQSADKGTAATKAEDSGGSHGGSHGGGKKPAAGAASSYQFEEVISNLSGTMGTRFIKASFEVTGESSELRPLIRENKAQVRDAIMGVMSSRTISELEAVGGRNALRVSLIEAINQALDVSIVKELYFMELIIQ